MAIFFGAFAVLSFLSLAFLLIFAHYVQMGYAVLTVVFAVAAWRARRSCVVIQTENNLIVREIQWTHRIPKDRVSRFSVEAGPIWPRFGRSGNFLVAEMKGGRLRGFREFNEPLGAAGERSLEGVALALNSAWGLRQ